MSDEKRYTITQVSELVGYESHVIRFYEKEFNLRIPRNKANHRYFTSKELEVLKYIKDLQERGFSNTQIKMILQSPETVSQVFQDMSYAAAAHSGTTSTIGSNGIEETLRQFKEDIIDEFQNRLEFAHQPFRMALTGLAEEVKELVKNLRAKEEDVLVCENAKLKMQLKQKAYELAELEEQLRKEKEKNQSFLGKVFKK